LDDEEEEEVKPKMRGKGKDKVKAMTQGKAKKIKVEADRDDNMVGKKKEKAKHKSEPKPCGIKIIPREGDLPPMSNLDTIFHDILSRVPDALAAFLGPTKYRKLRVATMCSGTESPLLALNMFARDIKKQGWGHLEIEHVFSCEIEPYKQAFGGLYPSL
jgi:hypothetical protein